MKSKDHSLEKEIRELKKLCDLVEESPNITPSSWFDPPATEEEILEWESVNGIEIPESYKEWLKFSDSSQILLPSARFFGVKEMRVNDKYIPEDLVVIGELIGDGELLCFSKETGKIIRLLDGVRDELGSLKKVLHMLIRFAKEEASARDLLGKEEKENENSNANKIPKSVLEKMLAVLEDPKNSPGGVSGERAELIASLKAKLNGGK